MKTVKLNVYEEQRKWMEQHSNADEMECDSTGVPLTAIYHSPLRRWRGLMKPDGTIEVPDMDYYHNASPSEQRAFEADFFANVFPDAKKPLSNPTLENE